MPHSVRRAGLFYLLMLLLGGCTGAPEGVPPVSGFVLERYLGTWYEIAGLDHLFERGLTNVMATCSLREEGGISVVNRGDSGLSHDRPTPSDGGLGRCGAVRRTRNEL